MAGQPILSRLGTHLLGACSHSSHVFSDHDWRLAPCCFCGLLQGGQLIDRLIGVKAGFLNHLRCAPRLIGAGGPLDRSLRGFPALHHPPSACPHCRQDGRLHVRRQRCPVPDIPWVSVDLVEAPADVGADSAAPTPANPAVGSSPGPDHRSRPGSHTAPGTPTAAGRGCVPKSSENLSGQADFLPGPVPFCFSSHSGAPEG